MANCTYIYLDEYGNNSTIYAEAEKKYGPELAEGIYIQHMMKGGGLKLKTDQVLVMMGVNDLKIMDSEIELTNVVPTRIDTDADEVGPNTYTNTKTGVNYHRVNYWLETLPRTKELLEMLRSKLRSIGGSMDSAMEAQAKENEAKKPEWVRGGARKEIGKRLRNRRKYTNEELEEAIDEYMDENPLLWPKWQQFTKNKWKASAYHGNSTHKMLEYAVDYINNWRKEQLTRSTEDREDFEDVLRNADMYLSVKQSMNEDPDPDIMWNNTLQIGAFRNIVVGVMEHVATIERTWGIEEGTAILMPEMKIYSDNLSLAGTVDLIISDPRNTKNIHILDYKTKNKDNVGNFFSTISDYLPPPFDDLKSDPYGKASAQLTTYSAILRDRGYQVTGGSVVVLEGYIAPDSGQEGVDLEDKTFFYGGLEINSITPVTLMPFRIQYYQKQEDFDSTLDKKRKQGVDGFIDLWSSHSAKTIRNNREHFSERKWNTMITNAKGNFYYIDEDPRSKTHGQRKIIAGNKDSQKVRIMNQFRKEYDSIQSDKKILPANIVSTFRAGERLTPDAAKRLIIRQFKHKSNSVLQLLEGLSPYTHTLSIAQEFDPELFGDMGPEVLIAKDLRDNSLTILIVSSAINNNLHFENDTAKLFVNQRTTLWGKYATNGLLRQQNIKAFYTRKSKKATAHQLIALKGVMAGIRYADKHGETPIKYIKVSSIMGEGVKNKSTSMTMKEGLYILEEMRKRAEPKGEFPTDISKMMDKQTYEHFTDHEYNALYKLIERGDKSKDVLIGEYDFKDLRERTKEHLGKLREGDQLIIGELKEDLIELYNLAYAKAPEVNQLGKATNSEVAIIAEALRFVAGIEENMVNIINPTRMTYLRSASNIADPYINKLEIIREEYEAKIRNKFGEMHHEHQKLLKDLMKEQGVSSLKGPAYRKMFLALYADDGKFDPNKKETWFHLKEENDPRLKKAQKAYIKFFNKHIKESLINSNTTYKGKQAIREDDYGSYGIIPLMMKQSRVDTTNKISLVKSSLMALLPRPKEQEEERMADTSTTSLEARFANEVTDADWQFSRDRREKVGENGKEGGIAVGLFETRLDIILSHVVLDGMKVKYLGMANTLYEATIGGLLNLAKIHPDANTTKVIEFLTKVQSMHIHDKFKKEDIIGQGMDMMGRIASNMVFAGSIRQAAIEFSTASIKGTGSVFTNVLNRHVFKGEAWFGASDFIWASKVWFSPGDMHFNRYRAMAHQNGMYFMDSQDLLNENYTKHDLYRLYQSRAMHGLNKLSINNIMVMTFMAYAKDKGFHESYEKNSDGHWVYNELKDKRFHVWDPDKKIGKKPVTDSEIKKYELWKQVYEELHSEGQVDPKTGKMIIPLSKQDRKALKNYSTRLFGSMGKDSLIEADYISTARAMARYKRWFTQRVAVYYTRRGENELYKIRTWDPVKKKWFWSEEPYEGIIQTVGYMVEAAFLSNTWKAFGDNMSNIQKENLSTLMSDMFMFVICMTIAYLLYGSAKAIPDETEEERERRAKLFANSPLGQTLIRAYENAYFELNAFATAIDMNTNIMPGFSTLWTFFSNLTKIGMAILEGEDAKPYAMSAINTVSIIRSSYEIKTTIIK